MDVQSDVVFLLATPVVGVGQVGGAVRIVDARQIAKIVVRVRCGETTRAVGSGPSAGLQPTGPGLGVIRPEVIRIPFCAQPAALRVVSFGARRRAD